MGALGGWTGGWRGRIDVSWVIRGVRGIRGRRRIVVRCVGHPGRLPRHRGLVRARLRERLARDVDHLRAVPRLPLRVRVRHAPLARRVRIRARHVDLEVAPAVPGLTVWQRGRAERGGRLDGAVVRDVRGLGGRWGGGLGRRRLEGIEAGKAGRGGGARGLRGGHGRRGGRGRGVRSRERGGT